MIGKLGVVAGALALVAVDVQTAHGGGRKRRHEPSNGWTE